MSTDQRPGHLPSSLQIAADGASFSLDPREASFYSDPYPTYARLHAEAPIAFWKEAGCLAITSHDAVSRILKDRRFGRVLPLEGTGRAARQELRPQLANFDAAEEHSLLELEPPSHTRLRALVTRAFVSRSIERLGPSIERLADDHVEAFRAQGGGDLVASLAEPLPVSVIADLVGIDQSATPQLLAWSHAMVAMYGFGRSPDVEARADSAAEAFRCFLLEAIERKRRRPGDNLLSALIAAETEGGRLSEAEIVSTVILLLNAGHEATVHQIGNGVKAILESRLAPGDLITDNASAEALVEECLRHDTPLHLFRRVAAEPMEIVGGGRVKRGQEVALLLGAANHDPNVFETPWRFDPSRTKIPHVSFGAGLHFCIGAPLARLELKIVLRKLFSRFPRLRITSPPVYRDSFHFRGLESLELAIE